MAGLANVNENSRMKNRADEGVDFNEGVRQTAKVIALARAEKKRDNVWTAETELGKNEKHASNSEGGETAVAKVDMAKVGEVEKEAVEGEGGEGGVTGDKAVNKGATRGRGEPTIEEPDDETVGGFCVEILNVDVAPGGGKVVEGVVGLAVCRDKGETIAENEETGNEGNNLWRQCV